MSRLWSAITEVLVSLQGLKIPQMTYSKELEVSRFNVYMLPWFDSLDFR
jgi:hypothetical protein